MLNWTFLRVIISQEITVLSRVIFCFVFLSWNISLVLRHVSAVTSVFPHWVASYVKTTIPYIWQCFVSSLNLAGLVFPPLLHSFFPFFSCLPPFFFFFFSLFLESLIPAKDPAFSHRVWWWRPSHCFLLQGRREKEAGWLSGCKLEVYVRGKKKQGRQIWWWKSNFVL